MSLLSQQALSLGKRQEPGGFSKEQRIANLACEVHELPISEKTDTID
jgi:hypothetical protein